MVKQTFEVFDFIGPLPTQLFAGFREQFFGIALGRVSVDISQQSNGRPETHRRRTVTRRLTQRVAQVLPPAACSFGQGQITLLYSLSRFFFARVYEAVAPRSSLKFTSAICNV